MTLHDNCYGSAPLPRRRCCASTVAVILLVVSRQEGSTAFHPAVAPTNHHRHHRHHQDVVIVAGSYFTPRIISPASSSSACFSTVRNNEDTKSETTKPTNDKDDDEAVLTDVDARVLQAMLREDKLALDEEDNLRQLLERGIRSKEPTKRPSTTMDEDEPSEYSSTVIKKLTNTKLWQAMQRNAADILESAKIFVSNKIERDSKLLGALGLFAFERAMQDVSRALPAATKQTKQILSLGNTTSFQAMNDAKNKNTAGQRKPEDELFTDMATPMDELKSVRDDLQQIFASGGKTVAGKASRRGLRTAAPAGMSQSKSRDRFARAYQRQQETTLQREKENVVQTTGRAASSFIDTAYELQREMQVEPNQAGYRTKALREGAVKRAGQLKAGAAKLLEAVQQRKDDTETGTPRLETSTSASFATEPTTEYKSAVDPTMTTETSSPSSWKPFSFSTTTELHEFLKAEQDALIERLTQCIEDPASSWLQADKYPAGALDTVDKTMIEPIVDALCKAQRMMRLEQDEEVLEGLQDAPSAIVTYQLLDSLKDGKLYVDQIVIEAKRTGSSILVDLLEQHLLYGPDKDKDDDMAVLLRLDQLEQGAKTLEERNQLLEQKQATAFEDAAVATSTIRVEEEEEPSQENFFFVDEFETATTERATATTIPRFVDVIPEVLPPQNTREQPPQGAWSPSSPVQDLTVELKVVHNTPGGATDHEDTTVTESSSSVSEGGSTSSTTSSTGAAFLAELVTDDDFDDAVGATVKQAVAASDNDHDDDAEKENKPGFLVRLALRSFDVVFFIIEKTITVAIPTVVNMGDTATSRLAKAKNEGLGSAGWELIGSAKKGSKRY